MARTKSGSEYAQDFSKNFAMPAFPFDVKTLMEAQRRNIQAMTEAQQLAMEGWQAVAQRQSEIVSQLFQDNSAMAKEIIGESTPENKVSRQADMFKKVYEKSVTNFREISEMLSRSNSEASEIINKRVTATMNEIKTSLEKAGKN